MKKLNYDLAVELCQKHNAVEAWAGLKEDWSPTKGNLLSNGSFTAEDGLGGHHMSMWATPIVKIKLPDGKWVVFDCYSGESDKLDECELMRMKNFAAATSGLNDVDLEDETDFEFSLLDGLATIKELAKRLE